MYDPTDTQAELNRKAVEALQMIVKEHEAGNVTAREASFAMKVLYTAVSGMLRQDLNDILNEQYNALDAQFKPMPKRWACTLKKGDMQVIVSHIRGTACVVMEGDKGHRIAKAPTPELALKKFSEIFAALVNKGWRIIKKEVV